ncbi:hypothetical protein BDR26DRAFT_1007662 [Obelidium mucronatum]|nr:hypothetical protein BDR26DRAFT_1007662 [Obelidium mucronatum]
MTTTTTTTTAANAHPALAALAPAHCQRLVAAVRGGDVVSVAAGGAASSVRLLALKPTARVQTLQPQVPFAVAALAVNQNGSLLALAGEFNVAVVVLPPSIKAGQESVRDVKIRTIGDIYHAQDTSRVVKISWHPMSDGFVHLMVLTADGCLRMYDIYSDPDEPEQFAYFSDQSEFMAKKKSVSSPSPSKSKGNSSSKRGGIFGIDLDEREAVSFAVGVGGVASESQDAFRGWSACTVYGLMKSGDVYALCPFVPFKSVWRLEALHNLKALNQQDWRSPHPSKSSSDPFKEKQFYWRDRWLDEAIASVDAGNKQQLPTDNIKFSVSRALTTKLRPIRQGPILVSSVTDASNSEGFAADLFTCEAGLTSLFVIAYQSKALWICIETDPVYAKWEVPEEEMEPVTPSFFMYERVQLGTPAEKTIDQEASVQILADPNHSDAFFVSHSSGAQLVSLRPWLHKLVAGENLAELFEKQVPSDIQTLVDVLSVDSSIRENLTSFSVIGDILLGYSYLFTTTSNEIHSRPLSLRPLPSSKKQSTISTTVKPAPAAKKLTISPYVSSIKSPFEIPAILAKEPSVVVVSGKDAPLDEALIRTVGDKIVAIRNNISQVKQGVKIVQDRVEDVQNEATVQSKILQSYKDEKVERLDKEGQVLNQRLTATKQWLEEMGERVDGVLQLLMDAAQPELSEKELAFMDELREMGSRIRSMLKPRLGQIQRQKTLLQAQAEELNKKHSNATANVNEVVLGTSQVKRMNDALSFEYKLLTETWKKAEDIKVLLEQ